MKSIAHAAPAVDVQAAPKLHKRNVALDRARTFLTLVVLLHHAVIPYTHFGHTDPTSWIGFDGVVLATDSFFMAMFFFLSGLFVWPGLGHKPWLIFLRDRLLRLGLPFVVCAFTVIPIAYYAIALRATPDLTFSEFWWRTMIFGPWPSGPVWFVWVLMTFDVTASVLYRVSSRLLEPINRLSIKGFERPSKFWLFLVVVSAAAYLPMLVHYGQNYWFELGPFSVQASRVLLYASYFFIGAGVGAANLEGGLLSAHGRLTERRWFWTGITVIPYCLMWVMIYIKREIIGNPIRCRAGISRPTAPSTCCSAPRSCSRSWPTSCNRRRRDRRCSTACRATPTACSWCTIRSCCGCNTGSSIWNCRRSPRPRSRSSPPWR